MKVLVTGGAGYIGSHTCKALAKQGFSPVTYDNLSRGNKWAVKWGPLIEGDLLETERLTQVLKEEKIQAVLHFAAMAYVGESVLDPLRYYGNNVLGSMSLLKAMQNTNVNKLIFSSTCAVYGNPQSFPLCEENDTNPISPYGRTKWMVERMIQDHVHAYGLSATVLRYFNAAGADPDLEVGESHDPETHLIPLALSATPESPLTVHGTDYPTADGTCIRDYIHVTDLAQAHVQALQKLKERSFQIYNLGTGTGASVKEIVASVEKVTKRKVPVRFGLRRQGDPARLVASGARAQEELGFQMRFSDLENIIQTAASWHQQHR